MLSISWIPSEAIRGAPKPAFDVGPFHYDDPPPEVVESPEELEELRAADRFRFANELAGWIEVADGRITAINSFLDVSQLFPLFDLPPTPAS